MKMTNRNIDKEWKKKLKSKMKEETVPSDREELVQLFRIESNINRSRGRGKGHGRGRGRSRGNGWTSPMQRDSDVDNGDSSDSIEHELGTSQRRSSRLSHLSRSTEDTTILSSESGDDSRKARNRRREKRGNRNQSQSQSQNQSQSQSQSQSLNGGDGNSSEEFEEESSRKRNLKQESSSTEDKRRRHMNSKEEGLNGGDKERWPGRTMRDITDGHVEEEAGGGAGGGVDSMEEEESLNGNCPTIITKNNKTVTLPDLNPPPLAKMSSLRVHIGCGLCTCRHTSDMVICNRCGDEFHASCLYGNDMDYNSWMCGECACVLYHLSEKYSYLKLGSEVMMGNMAPIGYPNNRFEDMKDTIEEKRLRWLLKKGNSLIGSRVWFHEVNVMGRILRRLDDLLLYYVTFEGPYWKEEGWYALEKNDIGILNEFVWLRNKNDGNLHFGVKVSEVENDDNGNGERMEALDLVNNGMVSNVEYEFEEAHDWREHKFELFYTPILDGIRWEMHVKDRLNRLLEVPWKVLNNRSELNAKEWMYKWIYMWSREVDFPLGGWARGVVLHYRSITGKHFVWFENEDVPSGWLYLNGQYIVVEGVNNEYE